MNLKLILAGSSAALVPVVAVPTALSLSNNTSAEKPSELSAPEAERSLVPDLPPIPQLQESKDTTVSQLPLKFPFSHPSFPDSIEVTSFESLSSDSNPETSSQKTYERIVKSQDLAAPLKNKLLGFGSSFDHTQINNKKGDRKAQFKSLVDQTDQLREASKQEIKDLLSKEEFKNENFQTIFAQALGFDLILQPHEQESYRFINLSIIRKAEVEAQIEKDKSESATPNMVGTGITPEDIKKFCESPSPDTSHLGVYSSSRKDEEETKEYMFFNYYSYCSKGSYYLKPTFDSDVLPSS